MLFLVCLVISDLNLFHLIVFLNPVFDCPKTLLLSLVDKVTTGTYSFVSILLKFAIAGLLTAATEGSASGSGSLGALFVLQNF